MSEVDAVAIDRLLRRIFGKPAVRWHRVPEGVSTQVYRILRGEQNFYLRLPLDATDSFAAECAAHIELRALGVSVPEVVHYEALDEDVRRSVMITTEIPGRPLATFGLGRSGTGDHAPEQLARIARAAGRDLALINQVAVNGFGWIQHDRSEFPLPAEHREYRELVADLDSAPLRALGFDQVAVVRIEQIVADEVRHAPEPGHGLLAHGDFYVSQVFHHDGQYTGMIDFGNIQGTNGWHDLATFRLSDPEQDSPEDAAVPHLEAGYVEVAGMPTDFHTRVCGTAVMIMAERLARQYASEGHAAFERASFRIFLHHLRRLLRDDTGE